MKLKEAQYFLVWILGYSCKSEIKWWSMHTYFLGFKALKCCVTVRENKLTQSICPQESTSTSSNRNADEFFTCKTQRCIFVQGY